MMSMKRGKMKIQRGDVVLVLFPNSDLRTAKRRPAVIIQTNNLNTGLSQIIVAMITSNVRRASHPSRVFVSSESAEGQKARLITDSVVMTDNIATVVTKAIDRIIGSLSMKRIDQALKHTLGL